MSESAAAIRSRLGHPVVDADGHWLEFGPLVRKRMREIGGAKAEEGFRSFPDLVARQLSMSLEERRRRRVGQQAFWSMPTRNTRDRATALMPPLLYERLDELGLDFCVLYPTAGLGVAMHPDTETRKAASRAFNIFQAEHFERFSDRLTPAAVIPMHTPDEALDELDFVTQQLGLKVILMASLMRRPIESAAEHPEAARTAVWYDTLGLDSAYNYDPVWARCVELGLSPTFHSGGRSFALRNSPSNFVYNHIGHFASAGEAVCKALFLGGVTRRFPTLKFGFLEGGVGWACQLYSDLIEHWEKRSAQGLEAVDPAHLDVDLLRELAARYGGDAMVAELTGDAVHEAAMTPGGALPTGGIENLDDFSACEIQQVEDFRPLFERPFYFGCEADDRMTAWAYHPRSNPFGARLHALFGSDIGHFDVEDMTDVLPEAHELVEDGLITAADFRDFVFADPVRFWGEANPDFFKGTVVEKPAAEVLAAG